MMQRQRELSVYLSQGDHRRMLEDDTYFSVTSEDVHRLLKKMALAQCPRDDIVKVRKSITRSCMTQRLSSETVLG